MNDAIFWIVVYVSTEVVGIPDLTNEMVWLDVPRALITGQVP
jgi:hypothetical protein